jgi:asparagine synthase (glutamine-hydrolysing)
MDPLDHVDAQCIERMNNSLIHRGPDDSGTFVEGNIGLGHRRLSIIDLKRGHQPMSNEDGSIWIAYNGEVYNHSEFVPSLKAKGHRYKSDSDTETILHLYEEHGLEVVEYLRGMFAFAIYERKENRLVIARDRLGIKPLYYHFENGNLIWASEIKALLASGYVKPRFQTDVLPDYLSNRYTSGEETFFEGVKRLLPGHLLIWESGTITIRQYWDLEFQMPEGRTREKDIVENFRNLFETSVRLRLMSDVPLGMFLSGGIDSSAIVAMMSRMVNQPIKTFSVAFEESEANELYYARIVSKRYGTDHHEVTVTPNDFFGKLPRLIWQEDEPIAFPSSVPLYFVSKLAGEQVKVVLTGEGSDELLAGYAKYKKTLLNLRAAKLYARVMPFTMRQPISKAIKGMEWASPLRNKLLRTFLCLQPDLESIYFDNFAVFSQEMLPNLLSPRVVANLDGIKPYRTNMAYFNRNNAYTLLDRILYTDIKTYLQELLMKQDQMSMAASIESRVPFLDHKLVEFVATLPPRLKLRGWTTKYILMKAMQGILPEEILRRKKMGFPVPIKAWFRNGAFPELKEYLLGGRTLARGYFNRGYVEAILTQHVEGSRDHSERLWSLLNFEIWNRVYIDGERVQQ